MVVKREVLERYGWRDPSLGPWDWKELSGGLKKWTKNVFTTIWCRGDPQAVSFQQHLGHTICPQFYPCKVRKTVLCVVKRCLNYFCPIKYLLVRVFLFVCFALLVWVFSFQPSHFLFFEIQCLVFPAQCHQEPKCLIQTTQEYPRQTQLSG